MCPSVCDRSGKRECFTANACDKLECCLYGRRAPALWGVALGATVVAAATLGTLVACSSLRIAPCEEGVCYTDEPLPFKAGDDVYLPGPGVYAQGGFLVHVVTSSEAARACTRAAQALALSCAVWREAGAHGTLATADRGIVLPEGYSCVVVVPPIRWQYEHELRHCREGAWHP